MPFACWRSGNGVGASTATGLAAGLAPRSKGLAHGYRAGMVVGAPGRTCSQGSGRRRRQVLASSDSPTRPRVSTRWRHAPPVTANALYTIRIDCWITFSGSAKRPPRTHRRGQRCLSAHVYQQFFTSTAKSQSIEFVGFTIGPQAGLGQPASPQAGLIAG